MAQWLAHAAKLTILPAPSNEKEIPDMSITSPRLTASTKSSLNNLVHAKNGFRFSFGKTILVYTQTSAPGELRQRLDLLSVPLNEFFESDYNNNPTVFWDLESFVLHCTKDDVEFPGDVFEEQFAEFLEGCEKISSAAPAAAPMLTEPVRPNTHSRWNSPEGSSLTNAMRLNASAQSAPAGQAYVGRMSSAPESIAVVKEKYCALMAHIGHVKHWIGLFAHLSSEDNASKEDIFKQIALPNGFSCEISIALRFAVKDLFTDQFLSAKQDGAYLGVDLSVSLQTELDFVSIHCDFKFD